MVAIRTIANTGRSAPTDLYRSLSILRFTALVFIVYFCQYIIYLRVPPQWATNDSIGMSMAIHGFGWNTGNSVYSGYASSLLGYMLSYIPQIGDSFAFSLFLVVVNSTCITIITCFVSQSKIRFSIIYCFFLFSRHLFVVDFTASSGFLAICACVFILKIDTRSTGKFRWLLLSFVFALMSVSLRAQSFLLVVILFSSFVGGVKFHDTAPASPKIRERRIFYLLLVAMSSLIVVYWFDLFFSSGFEIRHFYEVQSVRNFLYDFNLSRVAMLDPQFQSVRPNIEFFQSFFIIDENINRELLDKMHSFSLFSEPLRNIASFFDFPRDFSIIDNAPLLSLVVFHYIFLGHLFSGFSRSYYYIVNLFVFVFLYTSGRINAIHVFSLMYLSNSVFATMMFSSYVAKSSEVDGYLSVVFSVIVTFINWHISQVHYSLYVLLTVLAILLLDIIILLSIRLFYRRISKITVLSVVLILTSGGYFYECYPYISLFASRRVFDVVPALPENYDIIFTVRGDFPVERVFPVLGGARLASGIRLYPINALSLLPNSNHILLEKSGVSLRDRVINSEHVLVINGPGIQILESYCRTFYKYPRFHEVEFWFFGSSTVDFVCE